MKTLFFFAGFLFFVFSVNSQNTFPGSGNVGIGTTNPNSILHLRSDYITESSTTRIDANFVIEASGTSRSVESGVALGFVIPANTNGSNPWQQGRILVTPDNENNANARGRMYLQTRFYNGSLGAWDWSNNLVLIPNGNVGIGTTTPDSKLTVAGKIHSQEVKVTVTAGADFVFEDNYNLPTLEEVQQFIQENGHLPEIASAKDMEANGIHLSEMNIKLLQKIEELTLYAIEQENKIKGQKTEIEDIKKQLKQQHNILNQLLKNQ